MPKMRPCHASSKTSSPFFLGNAAWPDMSAISRLGTGSIELPSDQRAAGAGTTATPIIASRVTSSPSAASLRRSVPGGRCGRTRYRSSALESQIRISTLSGRSTPNSRNTTRGSRTGRERDESVRIAGAERADDEVVDAGRVLDHLEVDPAEAKLFDGRRPVGEEPLAVRRIDPGAGDDLGAVVRPDVLLVGADDAVDGLARDELLLDEQRLEGADPEREDGFRLAVMVPVFVVGAAHDVLLAGAAGSR